MVLPYALLTLSGVEIEYNLFDVLHVNGTLTQSPAPPFQLLNVGIAHSSICTDFASQRCWSRGLSSEDFCSHSNFR